MTKQTYTFSTASTDIYFGSAIAQLKQLVDQKTAVVVTDENVFNAHQKKFRNWNTIVLKPGEQFKIQPTADAVIDQLVGLRADRDTCIIGIGGGVITDLTGYVAAVYMRGIRCGFVPTSLLGLVDASIGGKNGIDIGVYKNMVGTIRQPSFILHDYSLLSSLPEAEWINGFAEIIKHACIRDAAMFRMLQAADINMYRKKKQELAALVRRNAALKLKLVVQDEFENGDRRLLNFGHTLGHALENQYELSHGQAISIGMAYAARVSREVLGFKDTGKLEALLEQYGLPADARFNMDKVFEVLKMDKKKQQDTIRYVMLEKIGKALARPLPVSQLSEIIRAVQAP